MQASQIKIKKYLLCFAFCVFSLFSCVETPDASEQNDPNSGKNAVFILCEGLWKYDNSSLSRYDLNTTTVYDCFYQFANNKEILGDLANCLVVKGDTSYIVLTTSGIIRAINTTSGKKIGSVNLGVDSWPRKLVFINDSVAYVSNLKSHSVAVLDMKNFKILTNRIPVGPAPEGIATWHNYVMVANSGYGDYLQDMPKASTISFIDIRTNSEAFNLPCGLNPLELLVDNTNNYLYAAYDNLPKYSPDSLGGIVRYDLATMKESRRWSGNSSSICLNKTKDKLYFISDYGISYLDLNSRNQNPINIIKNENNSEKWYSLSFNPDYSEIWIGNGRNYQIHGEILVYNLIGTPTLKTKFEVGINPNTIVFLNK